MPKCISKEYTCNGIAECGDQSDENYNTCHGITSGN